MTHYSLSENANINYAAIVTEITNVRKHSNADRLNVSTMHGNNVILGLDVKIGDKGVFFPLESQISQEFLHENNLYDEKTLNKDQNQRSYFNAKGRVRAIRLRGEKSEGFWLGIDKFPALVDAPDGTLFDTIDDHLLVKKYVIINKHVGLGLGKQGKQSKHKEKKLIENQFRFHFDTEQFARNVHKFDSTDIIHITQKLHGTSVVVSKVLCKVPVTWRERLAKWFGVHVVETGYDNLYSSRKVLKNNDLNPNAQHFYGSDVWGMVNEEVKDFIESGISIYAEIIGHTKEGGVIQKGYPYDCAETEHKTYVYRITSTNVDGKVIELTWDQVKAYCNKYGLLHVPEYYSGKASALFPELSITEHWHQNFLAKVQETYLEKILPNGSPDEGICIRKDIGLECLITKLKSFSFFEYETKQLDAGEVDIESGESTTEEENAEVDQ